MGLAVLENADCRFSHYVNTLVSLVPRFHIAYHTVVHAETLHTNDQVLLS